MFINVLRRNCSPILPLEYILVATIIQMPQILQYLTPSQGLTLCNDMIAGTSIEEDLMKFRKIYSFVDDNIDKLGPRYGADLKRETSNY